MAKILESKAGELTLADAFLIAVSKQVTERVLAPIIGNGSLMSGGLKVGGALAINGLLKNKIGKIISTGLIVDGTEDVVTSFLGSGNISGLFPSTNSSVSVM
jgi:hypothetical protein